MGSIYESICGVAKPSFCFENEEWSEISLSACTTRTPQRLTVGDFHFLPESLHVDERRCETDVQYRNAMDYLSIVTPHGICPRIFEVSKGYRDAVNLLAGCV